MHHPLVRRIAGRRLRRRLRALPPMPPAHTSTGSTNSRNVAALGPHVELMRSPELPEWGEQAAVPPPPCRRPGHSLLWACPDLQTLLQTWQQRPCSARECSTRLTSQLPAQDQRMTLAGSGGLCSGAAGAIPVLMCCPLPPSISPTLHPAADQECCRSSKGRKYGR